MLKSVNELLPKNGVDETIEKVALLTSGTESVSYTHLTLPTN